MNSKDPKDQAQRNAIIYDTHVSHFVEAGAGSGKTALLVERMLTLLIEEDIPLSRIAAITFTVKAAEELVKRLRLALTEVEGKAQFTRFKSVRSFESDMAQERARQALADLPGAAIETLHSFCLRLIRMYPLEVGVPPEVTKADELESGFASVLRAEGVMSFIDRIISEDPATVTPLIDSLEL